MAERFTSVASVIDGLRQQEYLADEATAGVVFLADRLEKPILVEGPAGVGKTELAKALAALTGSRLIRLQCYELIDEVDRVEIETEALLLEVLSDFQVSVPELGTITGTQRPLVVLTSNNTRELSEALKRRCLFLHLDYPSLEREQEIVRVRVPGIDATLADQIASVVRSIRQLDLKKAPSISETIDWARTLVHLGVERVTTDVVGGTLHVLLKYQRDIEKARKELKVAEA